MRKNQAKKTYSGILECPLRNGFLTFQYEAGDTLDELMKLVAQRWGYNHGFIKKDGTNLQRGEHEVSFDFGAGWLVALEIAPNEYLALLKSDKLPVEEQDYSDAPKADLVKRTYQNQDVFDVSKDHGVQRGILNFEFLTGPRPGDRFNFPVEWREDRPNHSKYHVSLLLIAVASGG